MAAIYLNASGLRRRDQQPWLAQHLVGMFQAAWITLPETLEAPQQKMLPTASKQSQTQEEAEQWFRLIVAGTNKSFEELGRGRR